MWAATVAAAPDAAWDAVTDRAVAYLKSAQTPKGSWGVAPADAGVTGLALTGLLRCGKVTPAEPVADKALKFVESLADPSGHLAGVGSKVNIHNYATSVNLTALALADRDGRYRATIDKAARFLKQLQWDESEGKPRTDPVYGGAGYGGNSRPDLSNTNFLLDALVAAGVPRDDPAFANAAVYVSRCQNLKGESNEFAWAGKINDGSFIYGASDRGETRGAEPADGTRPGYGSMTYAGVKSLKLCGVTTDDPRIKKAVEWLKKNYTVDRNPGMPEGADQRGYYYYLMTMARTFDTMGVAEFEDAAGIRHDWRAELTAALAKRQRDDGSWVNATDRWMEGSPELCTAYALQALSHCQPKK